MAEVSYLDDFGGLELNRDQGPLTGTDGRHKTWDLSSEDQTPSPPYLERQTSLDSTQIPIQKFSDVLGASPPPRPQVYPERERKEQFSFASTSSPPETTAAFQPPPKVLPLIRLTRVSKARTLGGKHSYANQHGTLLPDDRQQQQPLEYVRNPLQFRAKTNFTSPSPARNQTHSISLSESFDPWLVRIKDVLKNESSETDDVQPDEGMDEININDTTTLESLPQMIVREVGKLLSDVLVCKNLQLM